MVAAVPAPDDDDVVVFGTQEDYAPGPRFPVRLGVMGPDGYEVLEFAGTDHSDGGALFELSAANRRTTATGRPDQGALAAASERYVRTMLADDDGVPIGWTPTEVADDRWVAWDGSEVTVLDEAFPPFDECSSQRRFQSIIMSERHRVDLKALTALAKWLAEQAAKPVPTRAPTRSARGRSPGGSKSRRGRAATA